QALPPAITHLNRSASGACPVGRWCIVTSIVAETENRPAESGSRPDDVQVQETRQPFFQNERQKNEKCRPNTRWALRSEAVPPVSPPTFRRKRSPTGVGRPLPTRRAT